MTIAELREKVEARRQKIEGRQIKLSQMRLEDKIAHSVYLGKRRILTGAIRAYSNVLDMIDKGGERELL